MHMGQPSEFGSDFAAKVDVWARRGKKRLQTAEATACRDAELEFQSSRNVS